MLLPLLLACATECPPDDPVIVDPDGLLTDVQREAILSRYSSVTTAMADPSICLSEIRIQDRGESRINVYRKHLTLNATHDGLAQTTRSGLCQMMEAQRGYTDETVAHLEDRDPDESFIDLCESGPPDGRWRDVEQRACGGNRLTDRDLFLLTTVYPDAPLGRMDGLLPTTQQPDVPLVELMPPANSPGEFTALGDFLLFNHHRPRDRAGLSEIVRIDPLTGQHDVLHASPNVDGFREVSSADEALLLRWDGDVYQPLRVSPHGTVTPTVGQPASFLSPAPPHAFVGDWFWHVDMFWEPEITATDLTTGTQHTLVPILDDPQGSNVIITALIGGSGGFFARVYDTTNHDESYTVHESLLMYYDLSTQTWSQQPFNIDLEFSGVIEDRYLVGSLLRGSPFPDQVAVAAYDTASDTLLVSEDICPSYGLLVAGHTLVYVDKQYGKHPDAEYVLSPHRFTP